MILKTADINDMGLLFEWANDKIVRKNSLNQTPINIEEHTEWFEQKLRDKDSHIFIAYDNEIPVGQIRIDVRNGIGNIGYSISRVHRKEGYGIQMIKKLVAHLRDVSTNILSIRGIVKFDNIASQKIFVENDFKQLECSGGNILYEYKIKNP